MLYDEPKADTGKPRRPLHAKIFFSVYSYPDVTKVNELIVRSYVRRNAKYRNQDGYAAYIGFPAYATIHKVRLAPSRFQSLPFYSIIYDYARHTVHSLWGQRNFEVEVSLT